MTKALQRRLMTIEERAGLTAHDDEFLGFIVEGYPVEEKPDEQSNASDALREKWERAFLSLAATMTEGHLALVLSETREKLNTHHVYESRLSDPAITNLTRQFWLMAGLMVDDEKLKTRSYGLPAEVAQIYIEHRFATALDECRSCGYYSPVLLWTGSATHETARTAATLKLHLHPGFNAWEFFTRCPLCDESTGRTSEPYYFWQEVNRSFKASRSCLESVRAPTPTTLISGR
jgi:hypothetical protein